VKRQALFLVLALGSAGVLASCGSSDPTASGYADGENFALDQGANYWEWVPPDKAQSLCASDFRVFVTGPDSSMWRQSVSGNDYRNQWVKGCVYGSNYAPTGNSPGDYLHNPYNSGP
jgi:hypothetical protein